MQLHPQRETTQQEEQQQQQQQEDATTAPAEPPKPDEDSTPQTYQLMLRDCMDVIYVDSDEELEHMKRLLPVESKAQKEKAAKKESQREQHRDIDRFLKQEKVTAKCSW